LTCRATIITITSTTLEAVSAEHDSVLAAANLLAANGARTNEPAALTHYNLSRLYWDAVLHLTQRMATDPAAFREYYAWKLYLRTS
jgi:membrane-bound lytic murein transglycosylase B